MTDHKEILKSIQHKLEETQSNFIRLVDEIPDEDWDRSFDGEIWTIKQEMVHIVQAIQILPAGIMRAILGGRRTLLSFVPPGIRGWINGRLLIPYKARQETRTSIIESYKAAHRKFLQVVGDLKQEDLNKGIPFPRKYRTVEQLAYRPVEHFEEHEAHIMQLLERRMSVQ